jgi:hypothetical protein
VASRAVFVGVAVDGFDFAAIFLLLATALAMAWIDPKEG